MWLSPPRSMAINSSPSRLSLLLFCLHFVPLGVNPNSMHFLAKHEHSVPFQGCSLAALSQAPAAFAAWRGIYKTWLVKRKSWHLTPEGKEMVESWEKRWMPPSPKYKEICAENERDLKQLSIGRCSSFKSCWNNIIKGNKQEIYDLPAGNCSLQLWCGVSPACQAGGDWWA